MASDEHLSSIKGARVLLVGAGGIGFELLNNLVLYGFQDIHIIGLGAAEISNLNRQWHAGLSHANVAQDAGLNITWHANVKDPRFNVDFFKEFDIVLNGLDDIDARHHVNGLCLAAGVPLIETETEGLSGLVSVHLKGKTQCYDCQPRPAPETYPVRTMTSAPSKYGHCIVWAKDQLFTKMFSYKNKENDLNVGSSDAGGSSVHSEDVFERKSYEDIEQYGRRIYNHAFGYNIEVGLSNEYTGQNSMKPRPIFCEDVILDNLTQQNGNLNGDAQVSAMVSLGLKNPDYVWSLEENSRLFLEALKLFFVSRPKEIGNLTFDKDDQLAMEFVTAAANIRASSFGIPVHSLFEAKGIAGSILHVVATTNSIVAGRIVIEAIKVLQKESNNCRVSSLECEAKRKSWSREDDKILITSWLNVSKDQSIGTDQKPIAFWLRVADYYNKFQSSGLLRSGTQCRCHWQKLSKSVSIFVACYSQAKQNQKSGESKQDVLMAAHAIYKSDMKKAFMYEHAWHLLKKQQKWTSYALQSSNMDSDSSKRLKINERGDYSSSSNPDSPTSNGIEDESIIRDITDITAAKWKGKQCVVVAAAQGTLKLGQVDNNNNNNNKTKLSSMQIKREWIELKKLEIEAKVEATRLKKYSMLLELANHSSLTPVQKLIHDKLRYELFEQ